MTIPSSTRHLEEVRRFVERHAAAAGLPEEYVEQFKIAVDEACTNVIKHAYHGEPSGTIDIAVLIEPEQFTVRIRDEGNAFHPDQYQPPDIFESIKKRKAGGYGVLIMNRLMDNVEYRTQGKVNEVSLTKYRAPRNGLSHTAS